MKTLAFRLSSLLFLLAGPPLLVRCDADNDPTEMGVGTAISPAIAQQKLWIASVEAGVELIGSAGAVTPGATVTVTNQTTAEQGDAIARADGSVSVVVAGSLQDEYEVTASNSVGTQTLQVFADSNGRVVESNTVSCEELSQKAGTRASQVLTDAPRICSSDNDCSFVTWRVRCVPDCGNRYEGVASLSADELNSEVRSVEHAFCDEFDARACPTPLPLPCTMPPSARAPSRPGCVDGRCAIVREMMP